MKYLIRDKGGSVLELTGEIIGHSSSKRNDPRWIEFTIYRSVTDQYVVERVGKSEVFHQEDCYLVTKNRLSSVPYSELPGNYRPCIKCHPSRANLDGLYPERDRVSSQICETARGVVRFMEQTDDNQLRYLTNVAREALAEAAEVDDDIYDAYMVRTVD